MFKEAYYRVAKYRKVVEVAECNRHVFGEGEIRHMREEHQMMKDKFDALKRNYDDFNKIIEYLKDERVQ